MLFRLGWKDLKHMLRIHLMIILLLVAAFLITISIISAIQVKLKKYSALSPYLNKNGVYIESFYLAKHDNNTLLRDEQELKEYLPAVRSVLSMEQVWDVSISEYDLPITLWCYSQAVVDSLSPSMESGRWFTNSDLNSDCLKAVVTHNEMGLNAGDFVSLETGVTGATQQVEIIGVIQDKESLFYNNASGNSYGDYRDCYYTYSYEAEEGNLLMLLADTQILNGEEKGNFGMLNYRLEPIGGFQKEMTGGTLLTYDDTVSSYAIDEDMQKLNQSSMIYKIYNLQELNKNSWNYIFEELYNYLPVFICIFIFVIIAAVSANAITVKNQLKNYAIYYICGLPWKSCAKISLCVATITSGVAYAMVVISICLLNNTGIMKPTALQLGFWQMIGCGTIILCYILLAWCLPLKIVKNTSAKEIMTNHQ